MNRALNAHFKASVLVLVASFGIGYWYFRNEHKLPVNQSPADFKLIEKMETEGVPKFELPTLNGEKFKLEKFSGKIVIVNFWASWCGPCIAEFPSMIQLARKFAGKLVILAVATDDDQIDVENFVKAMQIPREGFIVLWDEKKTVADAYGVSKIPESYIVGKDQKLLRKILGAEDWASADATAFFAAYIKN